jgi:NADH dehydrogenase
MQGRVFVTGSSGFVGSAVVAALAQRGRPVTALVNRRKEPEISGDLRISRADLFNPTDLAAAMADCSAVIHLVGIIMEKPSRQITFQRLHVEATASVLQATAAAQIRRYVHMSAIGARPDAPSTYHKTKWQAEELVRQSALDWTILRPSMIHGPRGDFMQMEAKWARKQSPPFLFMPYFGAGLLGLGGAGRLQPIDVNDVARGFVDALEKPATIARTYCMGGADQLTWPQMHRAVSQAILGKRRLALAIPAWYAKAIAAIVPGSLLPFNRDQVVMSQEDNLCDLTDFERDFGWKPAGFEASLKQYAAKL